MSMLFVLPLIPFEVLVDAGESEQTEWVEKGEKNAEEDSEEEEKLEPGKIHLVRLSTVAHHPDYFPGEWESWAISQPSPPPEYS